MKVMILCGGMGTRLREETEYKPKPMVEIGGKPILWHIMKSYAAHGYKDFILCLGYKSEVIKDYFYNYEARSNDFTVELGAGQSSVRFHNNSSEEGWKVTLAHTGEHAMTGARIKRAAKYLDGGPFMVTYGDGLSDVNITELVKFHKEQGRVGTVTGVFPPSRFGELKTKGHKVANFAEKPRFEEVSINGGFFVFEPKFLSYLSDKEDCVLEAEPLVKLSKAGQMSVFRHTGFWQCMDTYRDFKLLSDIWETGKAPWKLWKEKKG
jgi:glucose-1-phosphate cytidylyltransferase